MVRKSRKYWSPMYSLLIAFRERLSQQVTCLRSLHGQGQQLQFYAKLQRPLLHVHLLCINMLLASKFIRIRGLYFKYLTNLTLAESYCWRSDIYISE